MTLLVYLAGRVWTLAVLTVMVVVRPVCFLVRCSWPRDRVVMCVQPRSWPEVPAGTARVAKRAFRKGALAIRARGALGAWCADEAFRGAYGVRGAPGISPAQLAMVTVLQFTENLTDRQAADAVRGRLDWKYCLGLELDDEGSGLFRAERVPGPAGGRGDGGGAAGGAAGPAGRARPGRGGD